MTRIALPNSSSAIVLHEDGTKELYVPNHAEDEEASSSSMVCLAVAIALEDDVGRVLLDRLVDWVETKMEEFD